MNMNMTTLGTSLGDKLGLPPNEVRGVFEVDDRQTVRDGMGVDHTPFQNGLVLAYNIRNTLLYNDRIMIKKRTSLFWKVP
jgi:hypothetical protein